jgi:hypothetical protein
MSNPILLEQTIATLGGRITCPRCQAKSKRTKLQCRAPASKGKTKCRFHGGASTGPKTEAGRQRCAEAKTTHGRETRSNRAERSQATARLSVLEQVGFEIGLMTGKRTRGRKPSKMGEAYPELQAAVRLIRKSKTDSHTKNYRRRVFVLMLQPLRSLSSKVHLFCPWLYR